MLSPYRVLDLTDMGSPTDMVDEVRWFVYELGSPQTLPIELQPTRTFHFRYDLHGAALAAPEVTYVQPEGEK